MPQPRQRSPLYRLRAYGITNPWNVYALQHGGLDEWCPACSGRGFTVLSPCARRESTSQVPCTPQRGCTRCRRSCSACRGARLTPPDGVRAEDFGDLEDAARAMMMFPGLQISPFKRLDMEARAL